jgi:hypothetical protein
MNIFELTGEALDLAVAQCEGHDVDDPTWWADFGDESCYSTDWAQGGPIIEREMISISREFGSSRTEWAAWTPAPMRDNAEAFGYGSTPLEAAMRCYVVSKLGATL